MGYIKEQQIDEVKREAQELIAKSDNSKERSEFLNLMLTVSASTKKELLKIYDECYEKVEEIINKTEDYISNYKKVIKILKKALKQIKEDEEKQKIEDLIKQLKEAISKSKQNVKDFKRELNDIEQVKIAKAHSTNNTINWITGISLVLSFLFVGVLQGSWTKIVYAVVVGVCSILLFVWKIYFIRIYIPYGTSDVLSKIILYLSKLSTTVLILLGFLYITVYTFTFSFPDFIGWILIAIIFVKVVVLLYDFFCSSGFYKDLQENIIWLFVSIIIVATLISPLIKNQVVLILYKGFLIAVALLLTALVLKRLLLDMAGLREFLDVFYLVVICLITISLTVYAIYNCCWIVGSESQPLFTAIVGIYAALIGGALTLGGVAWTIKKADSDRKEENRGKARPFFGIIDTDNFKSEVSSKLEIGFRPKEFKKLSFYKEINIENSDKVPFFIEKFVIGEREYYPDSTLLISKGMMCALIIYEEDDKKTNINKFYLYLTDINYEQRKYEIEDLGSYRYTIKEI